jgi:hypothetical protein
MRVHLSPDVIRLIYALREAAAPIRAALEELKKNPDQVDAIRSPERAGRREIFVRVGAGGYWLGYEIDRTGGETVIIVGMVEEN